MLPSNELQSVFDPVQQYNPKVISHLCSGVLARAHSVHVSEDEVLFVKVSKENNNFL